MDCCAGRWSRWAAARLLRRDKDSLYGWHRVGHAVRRQRIGRQPRMLQREPQLEPVITWLRFEFAKMLPQPIASSFRPSRLRIYAHSCRP